MKQVGRALIWTLVAWLVIASWVHRFRHPWMTETELFLTTHKAMVFQAFEEPGR